MFYYHGLESLLQIFYNNYTGGEFPFDIMPILSERTPVMFIDSRTTEIISIINNAKGLGSGTVYKRLDYSL